LEVVELKHGGSDIAVEEHNKHEFVQLRAAWELEGATAPQMAVSAPCPSWNRSILTEIYLCHACSCHEILRMETARQAIREGFFDLLPDFGRLGFGAGDMALLLHGTPEIDLSDWKWHTEYRGGYGPEHATIQAFWRVLEGFDEARCGVRCVLSGGRFD
jgi:hypothetical protein